MSPEPAEPTQRLFFALWPPEEARQALARASAKAVRSSGGRAVPAQNLHVTLAFLGSVARRRLPEVKSIGGRLAAACAEKAAIAGHPPIALRFETVAHWPRQQLLCALAGEEAPLATRLAAALKDAAALAGFPPDLKPFSAHVTVARKVTHAPRRSALRSVIWQFDAFALLDSRTEPEGPIYSVLESYPLVKREKPYE